MSFLKHSLLIILVILSTNIAASQASDLNYQNKPIDPLCFSNQDPSSNQIKLSNCGIKTEQGIISGHNTSLIKKGFYGFEFKYDDASQVNAYSYYKIIGKVDNKWLIYTLNSGGGSGSFTNLLLVQRHKNNLTIDFIAGGDRCNGGLSNIKFQNNILSYEVNLTAFDLLEIANNNPHQLKAYDDLEACAACCIATALIKHKVTTELEQGVIEAVDLEKEAINNDVPSDMPYQTCFNQYIENYLKQNASVLNMNELKKLVQNFNHNCPRS